MNRITLTTAALVASTVAALAQDGGATCKPLTDEAACKAASACRWTAPKEVKLPNGTPVALPGICRFKPGVASAIKAAASK